MKTENVYFSQGGFRGNQNRGPGRGNRGFNRGRGSGRVSNSNRGRGNKGWRGDGIRRNPLDRDGNVTKCLICGSELHYASACQHRDKEKESGSAENPTLHLTDHDSDEEPTLLMEHIVCLTSESKLRTTESRENSENIFDENTTLYLADERKEEHSEEVVFLESECKNIKEEESEEGRKLGELLTKWNAAILDTGATRTVSGRVWVNNYIDCLAEEERDQVQFKECDTSYRFGDGKKVNAKERVTLPAKIGKVSLWITTDIVDKNIPLLLSRQSMKKGKMKLDFENDRGKICGEEIAFKTTSKGHYILPLTNQLEFMHRFEKGQVESFNLSATKCNNDHETALKLHKVFAHPSEKRLISLIESAGKKWSENKALKKEIKEVSQNCKICEKFRRPSPRPVVGLSMATKFNECVAMDLKFYEGKIILHMIDHASRLSSANRISSKEPTVIIKSIFKNWITIYGRPEKFLSDNGGEFMNHQFIELCEKMSISVKNTAGESPWSNGLVERHNLVIAEMMDKVLAESECDFDLSLAWCLNAKNSLKNVNGYTPYQISMGQNPTLPVAVENELPGNSLMQTSDIVRKNLNAMHLARKTYIETESSRKIKTALSHNVRTDAAAKFYTGDRVFYKRDSSTEWKGPGTVIGQDGSKVIIKHGPYHVSVHPCRVALKTETREREREERKDDEGEKFTDGKSKEKEIEDKSNKEINHEKRKPNAETEKVIKIPWSEGNTQNDDNDSENEEISTTEVTMNEPDNTPEQLPERKNPGKGERVSVNVEGLPDKWSKVELVSRAGKASGKYKNAWNVQDCNTGEQYYVDLNRVQWSQEERVENTRSESQETPEECLMSSDVENLKKNLVLSAKLKELESWKENEVYDEVEDIGQDRISVRWVVTEKMKDDKVITKARLCARGFEEIQDFRKDSPTCSKECIRMVMALTASMKWSVNSMDIKTAFLQGRLFDREVYLKPPKEANTDKLWKLNKCVYGLGDASRQWYLTLMEEILKTGGMVSTSEPGLFFCQNAQGTMTGLLPCHVDDLLWSGTNKFKNEIVKRLYEKFKVGTSSSVAFEYVGIEMEQEWDTKTIIVSQDSYIESIQYITISESRALDREAKLTPEEVTSLREAVGQLNWLSCVTRPDISFDVSVLSSSIKDAKVSDLIQANKAIKKVKNEESYMRFSELDIDSLHLVSYADASYNNLRNGGSQGGYIIFLSDKYNNCCPIEWKSNRLKRVVRSALAAETLACADCMEACRHWQNVIREVMKPVEDIKVTHHTDSQSLIDHLEGNKVISDRLLRVDVNAIRESIESYHIDIVKVDSDDNVSDILTKQGVKSGEFLEIFKTGKISKKGKKN